MTITAGGAGVLMAILLIFFYLVYEVLPLFGSASIHPGRSVELPHYADRPPLLLALEEQGEVAFLLSELGEGAFVNLAEQTVLESQQLAAPVTALAREGAESRLLGLDMETEVSPCSSTSTS